MAFSSPVATSLIRPRPCGIGPGGVARFLYQSPSGCGPPRFLGSGGPHRGPEIGLPLPPPPPALRLHLAIDKAAEDPGDYALAMQHFDAADAVRRGPASFDSAAFSIEIDRLIARCTPELVARAPELSSCDATDRSIEVDCEDLTRAPEPVIRRIIAACGLAWHDAWLRPECNPRAAKTPSKWQTRQPIYRTSIARWRRSEPWRGPLRAFVDDGSELDAGIARS